MTDHDDGTSSMSRRFAVAGDGSISGGLEEHDHLGDALRYSCRMAAQIGSLLDVGRLQWLTTLSSTAVTARVGQVSTGGVTLTAEVETRPTRTPTGRATVVAKGTNTAIRRSLRLVRSDLDADWCAVVTFDKRVVGALLPEAGSGLGDVAAVLDDVGIRALAVLGALDESYRETAVLLDYRRGSLMVVAVGGDVLLAFADKFESAIAAQVIEEVRAVLTPHDLSSAWTWGAS